MNVAAPADRRRVAEMLRDLLDGAHDRLLPLALRIEVAETPQRLRRELRAGPGAEVFCGDILPRDLAQIGVNLLRAHRMLIAFVVEILEQFVPGQVATAFDDACEPAVADVALISVAALAAEAEMDVAAVDPDMAIAQRRQPEALIGPRVLGVADAEQR